MIDNIVDTTSISNEANNNSRRRNNMIERNLTKPKWNMTRISKYIHIIIFDFLNAKEIFRVCQISRALNKSSKDSGIWEKYFPDQNRLKKLLLETSTNNKTKTIKELLMHELNVGHNMMAKQRY